LWDPNYQLSPDESVGLVRSVPAVKLLLAVETALFGKPGRKHITLSGWTRAVLLANGLDPDTLPPADRRAVCDELVRIGRATSMHDSITSLITAGQFSRMQAIARNAIASQEQRAARVAQPPAPPLLNNPAPAPTGEILPNAPAPAQA
jgi:hypothetical protein